MYHFWKRFQYLKLSIDRNYKKNGNRQEKNIKSPEALLHYFINYVKLSESPTAKDLISKIVSEEKLDKVLTDGFDLGGVKIAGDAGVSFATAYALFGEMLILLIIS